MSSSNGVLGVSGVCWVYFGNSTQDCPLFIKGCSAVCWVCWVFRRARACMTLIDDRITDEILFHARTNKPNKPNTLNTVIQRSLNLKVFICVGFVLGMVFFVLGMVAGEIWG